MCHHGVIEFSGIPSLAPSLRTLPMVSISLTSLRSSWFWGVCLYDACYHLGVPKLVLFVNEIFFFF